MRSDRKDETFHPEMPPVDAAAHLIAYLFDVGPVLAVGMGAGPVTAEELLAWQIESGIELQPWEARTLRMLSHEYMAESTRAEKRTCPQPWDGASKDLTAVANSLREQLERIAKQ